MDEGPAGRAGFGMIDGRFLHSDTPIRDLHSPVGSVGSFRTPQHLNDIPARKLGAGVNEEDSGGESVNVVGCGSLDGQLQLWTWSARPQAAASLARARNRNRVK